MPIYQIDIEKQAIAGASTGEYWTNRYLFQADTLGDAAAAGNYITDIERAFHTPAVMFTKTATRDTDPDTDIYNTTPVNLAGTYGGGSVPADLLPALLVVRCDIGVLTGRPSRKYYHLMLGEGSQSNGNWDAAVITAVQSNVASMLAGVTSGFLCDPQGQPLVTVAPKAVVTAHQFRRGSKRKLTPIITPGPDPIP